MVTRDKCNNNTNNNNSTNNNNNNTTIENGMDIDVDTAKQILSEIIWTCNQAENSRKLSQVKAAAGKEMIQIMQNVFPLVMQLQMDVIKTYGFPPNRSGLLHFSQIMHELERENDEIARLRQQIRTIYIPPIPEPIKKVPTPRSNKKRLEVNGNHNGSSSTDNEKEKEKEKI